MGWATTSFAATKPLLTMYVSDAGGTEPLKNDFSNDSSKVRCRSWQDRQKTVYRQKATGELLRQPPFALFVDKGGAPFFKLGVVSPQNTRCHRVSRHSLVVFPS